MEGLEFLSIRDHLPGIDLKLLQKYYLEEFYNHNVMRDISLILRSLDYESQYDVSTIDNNHRIKWYIHNLVKVDTDSNTSYLFDATFGGTSKVSGIQSILALKTARGVEYDNLKHEIAVAGHMNRFRSSVPNFMYMYGNFSASPPIINGPRIISWGIHDKTPVNYIMYENVGRLTLKGIISTLSPAEFIAILVQIILSLRLAQNIGFTHYNLTPDNVYIRNIGKKTIKYESPDGIIRISSSYIGVISNYTYSHINIDGQSIGINDPQNFVFSDRSIPGYDIYTLVNNVWLLARNYGNYALINESEKILSLFTNNYTSAPNVYIDLDQIFRYIMRNSDTGMISDNSGPLDYNVLGCGDSVCATSILESIGVGLTSPLVAPKTIPEYYDIVIRLQNEGNEEQKKLIIEKFNFKQALDNHVSHLDRISKEIDRVFLEREIIDPNVVNNIQDLYNNSKYSLIRSTYEDYLFLYEHIVKYRNLANIGISVARSYGMNQENSGIKSDIDIDTLQKYSYMGQIVRVLDGKIDGIFRSVDLRNLDQGVTMWYTLDRKTIYHMIH